MELLDPVGAGIGLNGGALCLTQLGYRHVWEGADLLTSIIYVLKSRLTKKFSFKITTIFSFIENSFIEIVHNSAVRHFNSNKTGDACFSQRQPSR